MRRRAAVFSTRSTLVCLTLACTSALAATPGNEPSRGHEPSRGRAGPREIIATRPSGPPHAWLFGTWTGGLFPVLDGMAAQDCKTQPTVAFAQDVVGHTSLTGAGMTRRVIETVRTSPAGAEFRFAPESADTSSFGCEDPNILHVSRGSSDQITFPNCAAFPYPLKRCATPAR